MKLPKGLTKVTPLSKALALLMVVVLPICAFYFGRYYQNSIDNGSQIVSPPKANTQTTKINSTTPSPIQNNTPKYSVKLLNNPNLYNTTFEIDGFVKNLNITPYITQVAFSDCSFTDDKNKYYGGFFRNGAGYGFNKALLPNESANFSIKDLNVGIDGLYGLSESTYKKCARDNNGYIVCTPISGIKMVSCNVMVSNNEGGPNRDTMMKVDFPN